MQKNKTETQLIQKKLTIPTYALGEAQELPYFIENKAYQGATGRVYPLRFCDKLTNERVSRDYDAVILENDYISVTLLPELGGKIHGAVDKSNGYEFIYQNSVIKPALIGLAGPWVSGGVEFNWPQHHRPTTFMPLETAFRANADGSQTCIMGEAEPFNRMRGAVEVTVYPDSSVVEAKAVVYNRTDRPLPFMWWNNLAVRVHEDYKCVFPPDVEWGVDHDRRAVISFPVMRGVFKTARPYDYGDGRDVTWYKNVKLPTSVMVARGQSDMDFLSGYDWRAAAGTVTVSDHSYSVGKKMWTWGDGDFGHAWCANLTDNGDRYIELMTGVYTDNQPDFTYIQPGETKVFSQVWYPINGIGEVRNATEKGAVSLEIDGAKVSAGACVTREYDSVELQIKYRGVEVAKTSRKLAPDGHITVEVELDAPVEPTEVYVELTHDGERLVSYQPKPKGTKPEPSPREIPARPAEIESIEELYLHGAHLMQYKHHTYKPEDYFAEALRRDPNDLRCNHAMALIYTERGEFDLARAHFEKAMAKLRLRNDNPADTRLYCDFARLERLCGNVDKAYRLWLDASWQYGERSDALYEAARIDCLRGDFAGAEQKLVNCIETNAKHYGARILLGYIKSDAELIKRVLDEVPLDATARCALWLLRGGEVDEYLRQRPEDMLDAALDFERAGFINEAVRILSDCTTKSQLIYLHLARLTGEQSVYCDLVGCHPNRLEDIAALGGNDWQSKYLLGCLYMDRMNYNRAIEAWEEADRLHDYAPTKRNLAQVYYDHAGRSDDARRMLEAAFKLGGSRQTMARILYELVMLYKSSNVSVDERVKLLEANLDLTCERDDCCLEYIILLVMQGRYDDAEKLLKSRRFNIYEGGEGKLTRHHGWLYLLMAHAAASDGKLTQALSFCHDALVFPENYGEGRHYSAQEANIYYYTGVYEKRLGNNAAAEQAFRAGLGQAGQPSEMTYFRTLCAYELGEPDTARELCGELLARSEELLENADKRGYFGVGMPVPAPYEQDIVRMNTISAYLLRTLGELGMGGQYADSLERLRELEPENTILCYLEQLGVV